MDGWVLVGLLIFAWFFIAPLLGILGFQKANRLEAELNDLRSQQEAAVSRAGVVAKKAAAQQTVAEKSTRPPEVSTQPKPQPESDPDADTLRPTALPEKSTEKPPEKLTEKLTEKPTEKPMRGAPEPQPPQPARQPFAEVEQSVPRRSAGDWEQLIAANWMIWIGGLTVAIGGLLLVRYVWEAGLLGVATRVSLGAIFGLVLVGLGFRADRWALVKQGSGASRQLPSILVAAGITVLNGAVFAAGALYDLIPPLLALASYVLVAGLAVMLAMRFGRWVAALGLIGAYFGPLFTGASGGTVSLLLAYAAGVTGGALMLVRLQRWPQLILIALIGAGFWGVAGLYGRTPDFLLPAYALALAGMGVFFGARGAKDAGKLAWTNPFQFIKNSLASDASLGAAFLFALLGAGLIWIDIVEDFTSSTLAALMIYAIGALLLAWRYVGYALLAPIGAALVIGALLVWPADAALLVNTVLASVAIFGGLGTVLALRPSKGHPNSSELAGAAALTPAAALFIPVSGIHAGVSGFLWGYLALCVAVIFIAVLEYLKRDHPDFVGHEKTAAAFALGALLSAVLAPFAFLQGLWLGSAMAVLALGVCLVYLRFPLPVLRLCGPLAVAGSVALLMRPWLLEQTVISPVPIFNELLFGFGIAIAALGAGAWLVRADERLHQAMFGGAMILAFALIGLEIRHFAQGGNLYAPGLNLGELSGYGVTYLGVAVSFAWRLSARNWLYKLVEHISAAAGAFAALLAVFLLISEPALGAPVFNLLLPALAMPALLMAVYASILRKGRRPGEALYWGWGAIIGGFIWITLETRRMLVGPDVFSSSSGEGVWAFSIAWLIYAGYLLFWGTLRGRSSARYASLGILLLAVGKVFLFDLALLEGVIRAASFICLGGCLIGIALFYQRYVFKQGDLAETVE